MNRCECKAGFFALRDCEWNAIGQCTVCQRMICSPHTAPGSQPAQCRDCWARREQEAGSERRPDQETRYDDDWAHSYRHHYYSSGYAPIHWGSHRHDYYDSYDARSFVATDQELDDGSDDAQAGFGDS